ncbi:hypothetical protein SteCoe_29132 [Stentor coeruleus]|uniref:Uncharacterized protein n=1 Tax=Stentor coeruleus TaxID=5963 RepID=A0A1R2B6M7_9CILI|nr:hypothetical protein SteCoe_29132 [Stentor coeruleus]
MKSSKAVDVLEFEDFSSKSYNLPLQQNPKRSISLQKPKVIPPQITAQSKSPGKPPAIASRLIQKRKSVERKIEEMRKQKIEAEMKEVQSKPKISSRSRKLAVIAEKKILKDSPLLEKVQEIKYFTEELSKDKEPKQPAAFIKKSEVKHLCDDDEIIGIEEDIQLIEACLNMEKIRVSEVTYPATQEKTQDKISPQYQSSTFDSRPRAKIVAKVKEMGRKSLPTKDSKAPNRIQSNVLPRKIGMETPIKVINHTPQRKFIKKKTPEVIKQRSSSMGNLTQIQFAYRSLSPYQISIKRNIEDD